LNSSSISSQFIEMEAKYLDLMHMYMNSQLYCDLVNVAAKTQTHFLDL
jgi:hypothetical protein